MADNSKRRRLLLYAGLVGLTLLVTVGLVEVVLRVYAGVSESSLAVALSIDPYEVQVEPHGEGGFRPRPERTFEYPTGAIVTTNERGYRGPVVATPKPSGTFRVVLLGGSTTFGWGVTDDATIAAHMRSMLTEAYPGRSIEVVNLAFDGYDSYQLVERLESDGLALEPDVLVVNTGVNDVRNAWFENIEDGDPRTLLYLPTLDRLRVEAERGGPTAWTRAKHWLVLARLPGWLRRELAFANARSVAARLPPREIRWDALDYFERNLSRLVELGPASSGIGILFSTPPSSLLTRDEPPIVSYWLHDNVSTQMYRDSLSVRMQRLVQADAAAGLPVVYVPHAEIPPELFIDDAHLTSEGNRRVAQEFVAALRPWLGEPRAGH